MSKYLPEGWTQDKIDEALEFQQERKAKTMNTKTQKARQEWQVYIIKGEKGFGIETKDGKAITSCCIDKEANARLIAASPELLFALENAVQAMTIENDFKYEIELAQKAIAKAKVES